MLSLIVLRPVAIAAETGDVNKSLAYLVSDLRIPFWKTMDEGVKQQARALGYEVETYSANNDAKTELESLAKAIGNRVDGIILSPTNSSAAVTVLDIAASFRIPVVIADIGTEDGEYVSYIQSDNKQGAYRLGLVLASALGEHNWSEGSVGIVAIPQSRANGRARTDGFMQALGEVGIKVSGLYQQVDFSYRETYDLTHRLIADNDNTRAIWLQGSNHYRAALDAIRDLGKTGEILLVCFDAEPEFVDMIRNGELAGAGMQQPKLMGEVAVDQLDRHLRKGEAEKNVLVPVLPVSRRNLEALLPIINRNVLSMDGEEESAAP